MAKIKLAVIGGGPAGMIGAIAASKKGCDVSLFEKNEKLGKKMFITGKGRCNLTNDCEHQDFFEKVMRNRKFMYSALYTFDSFALMDFFESRGTKLIVERGGRVFPKSNKSSDLIKILERELKINDVSIKLNSRIDEIAPQGEREFVVIANGKGYDFDAVLLACGGASYPATGSDGKSYSFAEKLGHKIIDIEPSLISMNSDDEWTKKLTGLSLKNIRLNAYQGGKLFYSEIGEMLFTHFGVSGPLVLTASSFSNGDKNIQLCVDMKPGLDDKKLDARLIRDFEKNAKKQLKSSMKDLMPMSLIDPFLDICGVDGLKICTDITKEDRKAIKDTLKALPINISEFRSIREAIISRGGVDVSEVDPSTMQSKIVDGLYFAGEMLDIDAQTGGFNLQIAFSTGYLAGSSIT